MLQKRSTKTRIETPQYDVLDLSVFGRLQPGSTKRRLETLFCWLTYPGIRELQKRSTKTRIETLLCLRRNYLGFSLQKPSTKTRIETKLFRKRKTFTKNAYAVFATQK